MSLTVLAQGDSSGGGSGNLVTVSFAQLASLAAGLAIGQISQSQLESLINSAAWQAEENQPEGAYMELDITGWTVFGTDYSQNIADRINNYWGQGQITVNGEVMQAWPGASAVAYGGNNTLTVQYTKGQPWILWIMVIIASAWVALQILEYFTGGQSWSLKSTVQSVTGNPQGNWWQRMNIVEKGAVIVIGGLVVFVGAKWGLDYWERLQIAKAGRSNIYIER